MTQVIYPTHTCFDDALDLATGLVREDRRRAVTLRVVHGIVHPYDKPFAHAWLEAGAQVFFCGIQDGEKRVFQISRSEYYAEILVLECTRYTLGHALRLNRQTGHYGPWTAQYRALCRQGESHAQ